MLTKKDDFGQYVEAKASEAVEIEVRRAPDYYAGSIEALDAKVNALTAILGRVVGHLGDQFVVDNFYGYKNEE